MGILPMGCRTRQRWPVLRTNKQERSVLRDRVLTKNAALLLIRPSTVELAAYREHGQDAHATGCHKMESPPAGAYNSDAYAHRPGVESGTAGDLVRVLSAEERRGVPAALQDDRRTAPAAPDLRLGHLRRRRQHAAEDRRAGREDPDRPEDPR